MQTQPLPAGSKPNPRTVSLAIAIILLVVGIGAGAGGTYLATHLPSTATSTNALCYSLFVTNPTGCVSLCTSGKTVTIGELLDLSSSLADQGTRAKDSSVLAINDINSLLSSGGCTGLKFATAVVDYGLRNADGLSGLQSLASSGAQVVVGPLNSGTAQYILSYAISNHIIMISPSSTATTLAISNDYFYRTVPNDINQGKADARMFVNRGATDVVIVQRHDTYGDGLANATRDSFIALGGHVEPIIRYDATAADAGNLVAQVKLASTVFAATNNTKTQALFSEFASKYPTQTCDSYCLGAYDDVWLGAMATIQAGSNNGTAIQAYLQQYISTYNGSLFGVTGSMSFQASGDRTPTAYLIEKVVIQSGTPKWVNAGTWDYTTDTITWTSVP